MGSRVFICSLFMIALGGCAQTQYSGKSDEANEFFKASTECTTYARQLFPRPSNGTSDTTAVSTNDAPVQS